MGPVTAHDMKRGSTLPSESGGRHQSFRRSSQWTTAIQGGNSPNPRPARSTAATPNETVR
eukprot:scaffold65299_cov33-Tisochrysis_lutea.AAC.3